MFQEKNANLSLIFGFPFFETTNSALRNSTNLTFFWQKIAVSGPYQGRIRAVSGPYQGRIRAVSGPYQGVSGPYQGRIRAKNCKFPVVFPLGIAFLISVAQVVSVSPFLVTCLDSNKKERKHTNVKGKTNLSHPKMSTCTGVRSSTCFLLAKNANSFD